MNTAVKVFYREDAYLRERNAYLRLTDLNIVRVREFSVPVLLSFDDELQLIEMGRVQPPFVVDFASAGVDAPLNQYPPEILAEREAERWELFGDRWPIVKRVIATFRSFGIYLSDVKPGNIEFSPDECE